MATSNTTDLDPDTSTDPSFTIDPALAASMGFSSFGAQAPISDPASGKGEKKRKYGAGFGGAGDGFVEGDELRGMKSRDEGSGSRTAGTGRGRGKGGEGMGKGMGKGANGVVLGRRRRDEKETEDEGPRYIDHELPLPIPDRGESGMGIGSLDSLEEQESSAVLANPGKTATGRTERRGMDLPPPIATAEGEPEGGEEEGKGHAASQPSTPAFPLHSTTSTTSPSLPQPDSSPRLHPSLPTKPSTSISTPSSSTLTTENTTFLPFHSTTNSTPAPTASQAQQRNPQQPRGPTRVPPSNGVWQGDEGGYFDISFLEDPWAEFRRDPVGR